MNTAMEVAPKIGIAAACVGPGGDSVAARVRRSTREAYCAGQALVERIDNTRRYRLPPAGFRTWRGG